MAEEQAATSCGVRENETNPATAVEEVEEQVSALLPKEEGEKIDVDTIPASLLGTKPKRPASWDTALLEGTSSAWESQPATHCQSRWYVKPMCQLIRESETTKGLLWEDEFDDHTEYGRLPNIDDPLRQVRLEVGDLWENVDKLRFSHCKMSNEIHRIAPIDARDSCPKAAATEATS